jgi:hypothetical protein
MCKSIAIIGIKNSVFRRWFKKMLTCIFPRFFSNAQTFDRRKHSICEQNIFDIFSTKWNYLCNNEHLQTSAFFLSPLVAFQPVFLSFFLYTIVSLFAIGFLPMWLFIFYVHYLSLFGHFLYLHTLPIHESICLSIYYLFVHLHCTYIKSLFLSFLCMFSICL